MEFWVPLIDKTRCLSWSANSSPCQSECPLSIDIEGYLGAIADGKFEQALEIIRAKCPLPSICGRVCHHPCERACKRGQIDEPISIRTLKRFVADQYRITEKKVEPVIRSKSAQVAIIGSGPAGLTAAFDLVIMGYGVTVLEAAPIPGGMLALGIPEFDLPQAIVQSEIAYIKSLGVEIKTNTPIRHPFDIDALFKQGYRAILIATGAWGSQVLNIPGIELEGVLYALPFLQAVKLGDAPDLRGKVAVIGGGNVAIDAARTALRLAAKEVNLVCLENKEIMPAFEWMISLAEEEGVRFCTSQAPRELLSKNGRRVSHLRLRKVTKFLRDEEGRIRFETSEGPQNETLLDVDWAIIAIGQALDLKELDRRFKITPKGTLSIDSETFATGVEGIFAAGDVVQFPGTVVESMAAGRKAAVSIASYLESGKVELATAQKLEPVVPDKDSLPQGVARSERQRTERLDLENRIRSFDEVELPMTSDQALTEAARCLRCKTCNQCLEKVNCVAFQLFENSLEKKSPIVDARVCSGCGRCARSCPYGNIHLTCLE